MNASRSTQRSLLLVGTVVVLLVGVMATYFRWKFPYGHSHDCILILGGCLKAYADDHAGRFPGGMPTPEGSLGLLYRDGYTGWELLTGKSVTDSTLGRVIQAGGLPGPDSCGWHYVEGLTSSDDPRLAIVWDKVAGLGHNGQRLSSGAREVLFVDGDRQFISAAQWPVFVRGQGDLLEQKRRRAVGGAPVMTGQFFFPSGSFRSSYDSPFELYGRLLPDYSKSTYVYFSPSSSRDLHGHSLLRQGSPLLPSDLTWYRSDVPTNGVKEYALVFDGRSSFTIVVEFTNSTPDMPSILFQMCGTWDGIRTKLSAR